MLVQKFQYGGPGYFLSGMVNSQKSMSELGHKIRRRLYLNVKPQGYLNFTVRLLKGVFGVKEYNRDTTTPLENAMWAKYLNLGPEDTGGLDWRDYLEKTDKRPSKGNINPNRPYYRIIQGHNPLNDDDYSKLNNGQSTTIKGNGAGMGTYTISKSDSGLKSYHDVWDINPLRGVNSKLPGFMLKYVPDIDFGKLIGATEYGIYDKMKKGGKTKKSFKSLKRNG